MNEIKEMIINLKENENLTDKEKLLLQLVDVLDGQIKLVKAHSEFIKEYSDEVMSVINN